MYYLEKKTNKRLLTPVTGIHDLRKGEELICGLNQGNSEELIVCENFDDIEELCKKGIKNRANINWYKGKVTFFDYK